MCVLSQKMLSNNRFLLSHKRRLYDRFTHNWKGIKKKRMFEIHNIKEWPSNESVTTFQMKQKTLQNSSNSG